MADIVYKVKETLDGYVPSNELKTIKPGVAYYVGMPLAGGADGMLEPTDKDPEYICMADFKPDDEVPRLDVPCMKVGPQIIFKRIDGDEETITQNSGGGGGGVQSDLSVNDESDPAFVKGRTHYKTESLTINGVYNDRTYSYSMDVPTFPGFKESDAVTVIWDGTEYEVTAVATSSGVYVGNWSFKSYMSPDTGHPFLWYYGKNSDGTTFSTVYAKDDKTHTIQIKDKVFSVPLDKKYLPLDVIYKEDLKDSMKPLIVEVKWSSIDSGGTISGLTLDKSINEITKAWNENREIRWYKRQNETSTREYLTFKADWFTDTNPYPTLKGFYLQRIAVENGIIYFYKIKINEYGVSGSRYALSQA